MKDKQIKIPLLEQF